MTSDGKKVCVGYKQVTVTHDNILKGEKLFQDDGFSISVPSPAVCLLTDTADVLEN